MKIFFLYISFACVPLSMFSQNKDFYKQLIKHNQSINNFKNYFICIEAISKNRFKQKSDTFVSLIKIPRAYSIMY